MDIKKLLLINMGFDSYAHADDIGFIGYGSIGEGKVYPDEHSRDMESTFGYANFYVYKDEKSNKYTIDHAQGLRDCVDIIGAYKNEIEHIINQHMNFGKEYEGIFLVPREIRLMHMLENAIEEFESKSYSQSELPYFNIEKAKRLIDVVKHHGMMDRT